MRTESHVINRQEAREPPEAGEPDSHSTIAPISDAQAEVERTFLIVGGITLVAALLAGYLLAARTAAPLRRMAATAGEVDAGDLTPRLDPEPTAAAELRTARRGLQPDARPPRPRLLTPTPVRLRCIA